MIVYTYDKAGFYDREVELAEGAKAPRWSTPFKPREHDGIRPWWSGIGWIPVPDDRQLNMDELKALLLNTLAGVRAPLPDAKYSHAERETWDLQLAEAQEYLRTAQVGPIMEALLEGAASKEDASQLAQSIVAKHQARVQELAQHNAVVQRLRKQIKEATGAAALPSYGSILAMVYV